MYIEGKSTSGIFVNDISGMFPSGNLINKHGSSVNRRYSISILSNLHEFAPQF